MTAALLAQFQDITQVLTWGIVLVVLLVAGAIAVQWIRRRLRDDGQAASTGSTGFTLTQLRELHQAGKLSTEEFEKAKFAIVAAAKKSADRAAAEKAAAARPVLDPTRRSGE